MALTWCTFIVVATLSLEVFGLLENSILDFDDDSASLPIAHAAIICSQDDETGVHIAAESLASDLKQITGVDRSVLQWQNSGNPISNDSGPATAIIVGSLGSSLIQHLADEGIIEISELEGKWETFMTTVVNEPLPSVDRALVIVGSDKRGAIFGVYTISEQCGQSPYAKAAAPGNNVYMIANAKMADGISLRTSPRRNMTRSSLSPRQLFKESQVSNTVACS